MLGRYALAALGAEPLTVRSDTHSFDASMLVIVARSANRTIGEPAKHAATNGHQVYATQGKLKAWKGCFAGCNATPAQVLPIPVPQDPKHDGKGRTFTSLSRFSHRQVMIAIPRCQQRTQCS